MNLKVATRENELEILKLWKKNKEYLGIPFKNGLYELIDNGNFFYIESKDDIIGICAFKIMKRIPEIRICNLCIDENYRDKGLAIQFLNYIIQNSPNDLKLIAHARDGVENNTFYDKYSINKYTLENKKTMNIRIYELDRDLIKRRAYEQNTI